MTAPQNRKKFKIAGLGESLWDMYGHEKFIGGSPANFAAHIAQAGLDAFLFSRVGEDDLGRELLRELAEFGVDISGVQGDLFKPTGAVRISLDQFGQPKYDCSRDVAFDFMRTDSLWEELAPQMDAVFFSLLAQRSETSREAMQLFLQKATTALKICDVNIRHWNANVEALVNESLAVADIIKMNQHECETLKHGLKSKADDLDFLIELLKKYAIQMATLTLGPHGCYLVTQKDLEFDPGYHILPADTSGAGDAFAAGLVLKILQRAPLKEAADFANRLGAFVSTQKGAVPRWTFDELDQFALESL